MPVTDNERLFEQIVRENKDRLYRICRASVPDPDDAKDLYQDVLVKVWLHLPKFRGEAKLSTWLYRIAINTAILYRKQQKKQPLPLPQYVADLPDTFGASYGQEQEQVLQKLHHCISLLEKQDRLIISLMLEEVPYKEIAEVLGLSVNHVGVKINRIKQKLATLMEQAQDSEISTLNDSRS